MPNSVGYLQRVVHNNVTKQEDNRNIIFGLENVLFDLEDDNPVDLPVKHYFTPGLYCREIFMPAGTTLTSKIHKTEHVYVISKGEVIVVTEDGRKTLKAPHTGITTPGTKRALYIVEDCIWTTMHPTDSTDLDEIEEQLIAPSYESYLLEVEERKLLERSE